MLPEPETRALRHALGTANRDSSLKITDHSDHGDSCDSIDAEDLGSDGLDDGGGDADKWHPTMQQRPWRGSGSRSVKGRRP